MCTAWCKTMFKAPNLILRSNVDLKIKKHYASARAEIRITVVASISDEVLMSYCADFLADQLMI